MVEININNLVNSGSVGNQSSGQSSGATNQNQLARLSQEISNLLQGREVRPSQITQAQTTGQNTQGSNVRLQIPQLQNFLPNQQSITINTPNQINTSQPLQIQVQSANVIINQGQPVLQVAGQVLAAQNPAPATQGQPQANSQVNPSNITPTNNPNAGQASQNTQGASQNIQANQTNLATQTQRFTAEIPLSNLSIPTSQGLGATTVSTSGNSLDQIIRNFLPQTQINASANNLNQNIRASLPQNIQNINLGSQNNLSIQVSSVTTPTGQQVNINPNLATANPSQIITGTVQVSPNSSEGIIRTEFGNFRVPNLTNIPNGSQISFAVVGLAQAAQAGAVANQFLATPTSDAAFFRYILGTTADVPLQNFTKSLLASQEFAPFVQRFFPNPSDKNFYQRSLSFLSGVSQGSPEAWLGEQGRIILNQLQDADGNLGRLQDVMNLLRNFIGRPDTGSANLEWNNYAVPYFDGDKLSYITIRTQRDGASGEVDPSTPRKFILDLEQKGLGQVSIEGEYKKNQGKINNLDIVLKTENEVDDNFVKSLSEIYNQTATAYDFSGNITFERLEADNSEKTNMQHFLGDGIVI